MNKQLESILKQKTKKIVFHKFKDPNVIQGILDKFNIQNRDIKKGRAARYAREMMEGRWVWAGDGIAFCRETGILADGQHTLIGAKMALENGLKEIELPLALGCHEDSLKVSDCNLGRSAKDILKINVDESIPIFISSVTNMLTKIRLASASTPSPIDVVDTYYQYEKVLNFLADHQGKEQALRRIGFVTAMAHFIEAKEKEGKEFYLKVAGDGSGLQSNTGELLLRNYLVVVKSSNGKKGPSQIDDYDVTFSAAQKSFNNEEIKLIKRSHARSRGFPKKNPYDWINL